MHRIRFPLELHPRPRWESLQRSPGSPRLPAVFKGAYCSGKRDRKGRGERKMRGEEKEMEGDNDFTHPLSQIPDYATDVGPLMEGHPGCYCNSLEILPYNPE